jgi:hypothetical protein
MTPQISGPHGTLNCLHTVCTRPDPLDAQGVAGMVTLSNICLQTRFSAQRAGAACPKRMAAATLLRCMHRHGGKARAGENPPLMSLRPQARAEIYSRVFFPAVQVFRVLSCASGRPADEVHSVSVTECALRFFPVTNFLTTACALPVGFQRPARLLR